MSAPRKGVALVRIRPTSIKNAGPDRKRTNEACALLPGGDEDIVKAPTHGVDENASDDASIVERLAVAIKGASVGRRSMLVDLAFDLGNVRLEWAISKALEDASASLELLEAVVIVLNEHPGERRRLRRTIASLPTLADRVGICNVSTPDVVPPRSGAWDVTSLSAKVHVRPSEHADMIRDKVIRRRGVFQSPFDQRFFRYWYSAASAAEEITALLRVYLREMEATHVVFDDNCEGWLRTVFEGVAGDRPCVASSDVALALCDLGASQGACTTPVVAVLGPMLRTGTAFRQIYASVAEWADEIRLFAVMANRNDADETHDYYRSKLSRSETTGKTSASITSSPSSTWNSKNPIGGSRSQRLRIRQGSKRRTRTGVRRRTSQCGTSSNRCQ